VIQIILKSQGTFPLASADFVNDVKVVKGILIKYSNIYPLDLKVAGKFQHRKATLTKRKDEHLKKKYELFICSQK